MFPTQLEDYELQTDIYIYKMIQNDRSVPVATVDVNAVVSVGVGVVIVFTKSPTESD